MRTLHFLQKKKNKSYQDGVLEVKEGNACTLFDEVGAIGLVWLCVSKGTMPTPLCACFLPLCFWIHAGWQGNLQKQSQRRMGYA